MSREKLVAGVLSLFLLDLLAPPLRSQTSGRTAAQPLPIRRILILNEQNPSYPAISIIDESFRQALTSSRYRIEIYREYLDANLFPDDAEQKQFRDFYVHKYQNRRPDVIVTVGSTANRLIRQLQQTSFAGIPSVFCLPGVDDRGDSDSTGVTMSVDAAGTLSAALRLLPNTKHLLVVGGVAPIDLQQLQGVREQLQPYNDKVDISYLTGLTMPQVLDRLQSLPQGYVVLLVSFSRDAAGAMFSSKEAAPLVSAASSVPVFSLYDVFMGHGEVGGDFSLIKAQGTLAASAVSKILDGVSPKDIPVAKAPNSFVFDWRALKRWHLSENDLPSGSTILNRQLTAWESYRWYFIGGISLILFEAFLISTLISLQIKRRRAEDHLALTNDRLRLAVEVSKSVGWDWDELRERNSWFGDLPNMFGIASDSHELSTGEFFNYVHPEDRERVSSALALARDEHKPYLAEFRIVRKDGSARWITARGSFYYSQHGRPERMVGMAVDISERKETEQKLQESERRFRLVANTAPVLIWTAGTDGKCDYFNKPWLEFSGRSLEEELGDGWAEGVYPNDLEFCLRTYRTAFELRRRFQMQYRLRRYDGEYRWLLDVGVPRTGLDGSFAGYIGSCIDVTERKLAEDAVAKLSGRLIAAQEEERSRIAREIHDDYQQRLALVANDLDSLREQIPDSDTKLYVRQLWNEISDLAVDMHSLSHRLHSSTLETLGLAAGVKAFCEEFEQQQGVHIGFTFNDVPRRVPPDSALCVFRVAQEALRNVKKHSGSDRAEVKLEWTGDALHLLVTDHGKGFDPKTPSPDAGIGIRSMEERLRLVGGKLDLQSQPSQGTTIDAWVPLKAAGHHTN